MDMPHDRGRHLPGAGVSKALFYFYFPRKENVPFEVRGQPRHHGRG
jgi:hypothetical protein